MLLTKVEEDVLVGIINTNKTLAMPMTRGTLVKGVHDIIHYERMNAVVHCLNRVSYRYDTIFIK